MSSTASPQRKSRRIKANTAVSELEHSGEDPSRTIQRLQDEIEELNYTKERLDEKVTQLEERAQFLEADARLSASIAAKEAMDLKEKTRQLEIELSLAVDVRDSLAQQKSENGSRVSDREVLDEAQQLSVQLKEAWLRISTMKAAQEETVNKLFKTEEANLKLAADVSKAETLCNTIKATLTDEQKRWALQKEEYDGEIESLKAKLVASSPDSKTQMMDWEQDKKRMRDSIKHERAIWDKEKKNLMDQIASLKIKATALHMQKAPPPEWTLEKHQLSEQCSTLQSRVAILESDRTVSGNQHKNQIAKLEKKIDLLKGKLVEIMKHAHELEAKAQEDAKQAATKKTAASRARRPKRTRNVKETDSEMESEADVAEAENPPVPTTPNRPVRSARSKGAGGNYKSVNYTFDSVTSSEDSSDQEEEEDEDVEEEENVKNDQSNSQEAAEITISASEVDITVPSNHDNDMEVDEQAESSTITGTRRSNLGRGRKAADSDGSGGSDSEFEPPKKVAAKGRGRVINKKQSSPVPETVVKKTSRASKSKSKENAGQSSSVKVDSKRKTAVTEGTPLSPESMADTPTTTTPTVPTITASATNNGETSALPEQTPSNGSITTSTESGQAAAQKIKKKRRLLTGKGLDDLGDILNGPGMTASASPSKALQFLPNKTKLPGGRTALLGSSNSAAPKEALNAIKMAFNLPKARNLSPTRDE
ncbi:hypothetical protein FBU30_010054 [Linnemannia zychae]|nr:hypothetical protein FBU30_010054 [Linnemannia zychae]